MGGGRRGGARGRTGGAGAAPWLVLAVVAGLTAMVIAGAALSLRQDGQGRAPVVAGRAVSLSALPPPAVSAAVSTSPPAGVPGARGPGPLDSPPPSPPPSPSASPLPSLPRPPGLADHPLHRGAGLERAGCTLDVGVADVPALRGYLRAVAACLDRTWEPVLRGLGLAFTAVVVGFEEEATVTASPCAPQSGSPPPAGLYCEGVITIAVGGYVRRFPAAELPAQLFALVAHEYGHHVQALAGILPEVERQRLAMGAQTPAGLELGRRVELHAQCLSGYATAVYAADYRILEAVHVVALQSGDQPGRPRTHGTRANNGAWVSHGMQYRSLSACNTFAADAAAIA